MDIKGLFHSFRQRVLPWIFWSFFIAGAFLTWRHLELGLTVPGYVGIEITQLGSLEASQVDKVLVGTGDFVHQGQIVAILDSRELDAELATAKAQLEAERAATEQAELRAREAWVQFMTERQQAAHGPLRYILDKEAEIKTAEAELAAVKTALKAQQQAVLSGVMRSLELNELQIRQAKLLGSIKEEKDVLRTFQTKHADLPELANLEEWIRVARAPQEHMVEVYQSQVRLLETRRNARLLRAPVDGQVTAVNGSAHSVTLPDRPLLEVASHEATHIVACVEGRSRMDLSLGMSARVRLPTGPQEGILGRATAITPVIELPPRCGLKVIPSWGRLVTIDFDEGQTLVPGTPCDVTFEKRS